MGSGRYRTWGTAPRIITAHFAATEVLPRPRRLRGPGVGRKFNVVPLTRKLQQLIDDLSLVEDPQERLAFVVDRAKKFPPLPSAERTDANRVRGCISVVWLVGEMRDGHC